MSTMRVTMTRTTMGESGSLLTAGSTYTVSTAFGAYLVGQAKAATDPDGALSPLGSEPLRLATNPVTGAASAVDGAGRNFESRAFPNPRTTTGRPTVVALKYNHWAHPAPSIALGGAASTANAEGSTYEPWDAWPWKCMQKYPERIPLAAREMRARPYWTWSDGQTINALFNGFDAGSSASLSRVSEQLRITAVTSDPILYSPDYLGMVGNEYPTMIINISRIAGASWDGKLYFITDTDATWNGTKSFTITAPGSWVGEQTLTVTLTGNATWNASTIRKLRFDFGASNTDVFDINSIEFVPTSAGRQREKIIGLPLTEQWAVDWELRTAYNHGVDVFAICHFQESLSTVGKHDWYFDRVNSSTVTEPIKICIVGIYQPPYNSLFTSTANIQSLADKYSTLITNAGSRYWTIDGRPVIQMFADDSVASQMISSGVPSAYAGGNTYANIKIALAHFVATIRAKILANLGVNPYIVDQHNGSFPGWFGTRDGVYTSAIVAAGFDAATSYIQRTAHTSQAFTAGGGSALNWPLSPGDDVTLSGQLVRDYATMVECRDRNHEWIYGSSGFGLPYWPHVTVGWARFPWSERDATAPNPEDLNWPTKTALQQNFSTARSYIDRFGPVKTGNIVTIYAWDEYGEGGVLAPTKGLGAMALEAMRDGLGL